MSTPIFDALVATRPGVHVPPPVVDPGPPVTVTMREGPRRRGLPWRRRKAT